MRGWVVRHSRRRLALAAWTGGHVLAGTYVVAAALVAPFWATGSFRPPGSCVSAFVLALALALAWILGSAAAWRLRVLKARLGWWLLPALTLLALATLAASNPPSAPAALGKSGAPGAPSLSASASTARDVDCEDPASCLRDPHCHETFVVAHRGNGFGAPENSVLETRLAVEARVPVIEIDVRSSVDGHLFVLHDSTLDRLTNLHGNVEGRPWSDLARGRLPDGEAVPSFADVYAQARGRSLLDLHVQDDSVERLAAYIAAHGSFDDVMFFVATPRQVLAAAAMKRLYPRMLVMPRVHGWADVAEVREAFGSLPEALHVDTDDEGLRLGLQAVGEKLFVKVITPECLPLVATPMVRDVLGSGVNFIETDDPTWLTALMRADGFRPGPARHAPPS